MSKILRSLKRILIVLISEPYFILSRVWVQLLIITLMFLFGAAIFNHYQGLNWLTALLGSVSTVTTIGLYAPNINIMPNPEKILLIIVIIASVGSAASILQSLISTVTKKEFFMNQIDSIKVNTMSGCTVMSRILIRLFLEWIAYTLCVYAVFAVLCNINKSSPFSALDFLTQFG